MAAARDAWGHYANKLQKGGELVASDIKTGATMLIGILTMPAGMAGMAGAVAGAVVGGVATAGLELTDTWSQGQEVEWGNFTLEMLVPMLTTMLLNKYGGK